MAYPNASCNVSYMLIAILTFILMLAIVYHTSNVKVYAVFS